jgi:hypothetical protein
MRLHAKRVTSSDSVLATIASRLLQHKTRVAGRYKRVTSSETVLPATLDRLVRNRNVLMVDDNVLPAPFDRLSRDSYALAGNEKTVPYRDAALARNEKRVSSSDVALAPTTAGLTFTYNGPPANVILDACGEAGVSSREAADVGARLTPCS